MRGDVSSNDFSNSCEATKVSLTYINILLRDTDTFTLQGKDSQPNAEQNSHLKLGFFGSLKFAASMPQIQQGKENEDARVQRVTNKLQSTLSKKDGIFEKREVRYSKGCPIIHGII